MSRIGKLVVLLSICLSTGAWTQQHPVLLVSIDGFRNDYLEITSCPNLRSLAASGARARWMIPVFPTKTFPNHYTIVTGLYAEQHGIVGNTMYDPVFDEIFGLWKREEVTNSRWWGGEPIWVTAERQGRKSATYFWPGSEALIAGKRPSYWMRYDGSVPYRERAQQVLDWLDYPPDQRPLILTVYFEGVDHAGHTYGPGSEGVREAVKEVDEALGFILEGLKTRGMSDSINIVVVSDHGMTGVEKSRTVWLDDFIDPDSVRVVDWGIVVSLWPAEGDVDRVYTRVSQIGTGMKAYKKKDIPERYRYRDHRRVAPIVLIADEGWTITRRRGSNAWTRGDKGGNHGYDNLSVSMRALFVATGPAFRPGVVMEPIQNIHVYSLLAHLLGIEPAPNEGDVNVFKEILQ